VTGDEHLPRVRAYDRNGHPHDVVLRTRSGRILTEQDVEALADEAERGYDIRRISPRAAVDIAALRAAHPTTTTPDEDTTP
jgi:hypothetical protein